MLHDSDIERKSLETPDRRQVFLDGSERMVAEVGSAVIGRGVYRPGWAGRSMFGH